MSSHIESLLNQHFPFEPTPGQQSLLYGISRFLDSYKPKCALLIKGYAGTGKTTVIGSLVKTLSALGLNSVLMAPTGRAAKIMTNYSGKGATTVHKRIYQRKLKAGGAAGYALAPNLFENTVFIVDEASMIGGKGIGSADAVFEYRDILTDLLNYVFSGKNCRLILIGDTAQLPPVGSDQSPAMDLKFLISEYGLTAAGFELTEVLRQAQDSGILYNATKLREQIRTQVTTWPKFELEGFSDIKRIGGLDLQEKLEEAFGKHGAEGVCVITRSNKRANLFNLQIRSRIFWQEDLPQAGDLCMVVKNNYHWIAGMNEFPVDFIANGDTAELLKIVRREELFELEFADAILRLSDYPDAQAIEAKILLNTLTDDGPSLNSARMTKLFEDVSQTYIELGDPKKIREAVMKDPYFNALQVKFAYAVTCHKAQGGQWPVVFIDQGYITEELLDLEFLRWLYTALTRASSEVYLLNFADEFFEEETLNK
jgi:exodeoxyribonuclease-5